MELQNKTLLQLTNNKRLTAFHGLSSKLLGYDNPTGLALGPLGAKVLDDVRGYGRVTAVRARLPAEAQRRGRGRQEGRLAGRRRQRGRVVVALELHVLVVRVLDH